MIKLVACLSVGYAAGDMCSRVCDTYSANRLGGGENLCDGPVSTCDREQNLCTNLYWATTGDEARGLIYSVDGSELFPEERAHPVTCDQAFELEDVSAIRTALQIFIHIPQVRHLLMNEELHRLALETSNQNATVLTTLRQILDGPISLDLVHAYRRSLHDTDMDSIHGAVTQPFQVLTNIVTRVGRIDLLEGNPLPHVTMVEIARCPTCNHQSIDGSTYQLPGISVPAPGDVDTVSITQLVSSQCNRGTSSMRECSNCGTYCQHNQSGRLTNIVSPFFIVTLERTNSQAVNVQIERTLEVSQLTHHSGGRADRYSLIAVIHQSPQDQTHYGEMLFTNNNRRWYTFRDGQMVMSQREPEPFSRTAVALVYKRQRRPVVIGPSFSEV